jgi:AcrR family transcriptional regulator
MEEKKEKTIEKAREYFHRHWYRKASLSELIAEIGISKPTFYNYFKNKEELFNTVMLATHDEFQYEFNQRSKTAASAMERLDIFLHTYAWFLETFPLYRDLYKPGNDLMPRWVKSRSAKDLFAEGVETIRAIVEQGQEEGGFDPDVDPAKAALIVYNAITLLLSHDFSAFARSGRGSYDLDLELFLRILGLGLLRRE